MKNDHDVSSICLEIFSKISASISHEIKNTLSIINENAGLLDDLSLIAETDEGVPAQQVQTAVATISKQVARSNRIMKDFNRFAHSADTKFGKTDLKDLLQLMVALTSRQAAMNSVSVDIECLEDVNITTRLLPLESLIFLVLTSSYHTAQPGSTVTIETNSRIDEISIHFSLEEMNSKVESYTPGAKEAVLADAVQGSCSTKENSIIISFKSHLDKA